jgi:hypothetical protein
MPAVTNKRASVFQGVKLAPETTPGTAATSGFKKLTALGMTPTINPTIKEFRPAGSKLTTVTALQRETTTWALDGLPTYTELLYPLASVLTDPEKTAASGTTSAAAGSRTMGADGTHWFFRPLAYDADAPVSFTVYKGGIVAAERATFWRVNDFTLTFNKNDSTLSGSAMARALEVDQSMPGNERQQIAVNATGGTYTLTWSGQTTASLDHDSTAAEVLAALEALSTIPAGSLRVTQTVAASPAFTYIVEFGGSLGESNVAAITATDSLTGGTSDVTITTPTAGAAVSAISLVPILPTQVCIYAYASAQASISDTTNETSTYRLTDVMEASLAIASRYAPYYTLDCNQPSFGTMVEGVPQIRFTTRMLADTVGLGYLTQLRNGGTVFFRLKAVGATISSAEEYEFTMDFAGKVVAASELADDEGVIAHTWTWAAVPALTNGGGVEVALVNNVTSM